MNVELVQENLDACMELIPKEDDKPWVPEHAYAEDAASALAYALRCRQNERAQEAAWAARCAFETVDQFVIRREQLDTDDRRDETRMLSYPLIQAELERQRRDLEELLATRSGSNVIARLRERAKNEARAVFTQAS